MTNPAIGRPNCKTEIRLTESLAAPLIDAMREDFQRQLAQKNESIGKREPEPNVESRLQVGLTHVGFQAPLKRKKVSNSR